MASLAEQLDASQGWNLQQALERTADPNLWDVWLAANVAAGSASVRTSAGSGESRNPMDKQKPIEGAANLAFDKIDEEFQRYLKEQRLVAIGSHGGPDKPSKSISSQVWNEAVSVDWTASTVQERSRSKTRIYNVRVFPILHAPDAAKYLDGHSLSEAFLKFVIGDPEVASAGKRIVQQEGCHETVFREGQYPGPYIAYIWPIDVAADDLVFQFVRPVFFILPGPPLPKGSDAVYRVSTVIAGRLKAFKNLLSTGQIVAHGTFVKTGIQVEIGRLQWQRRGCSIDVSSGDLLQEIDGKAAIQWSGLSLTAPAVSPVSPKTSDRTRQNTKMSHVKPPKSLRVRSSPSVSPELTPLQESIRSAIQANWPEGIPPGMLGKTRNGQIIEWQKMKGLAVASPKSIYRHLRDHGQSI